MLTSMIRATVSQMAWAVRSQGMPWVVGVLIAIAEEEKAAIETHADVNQASWYLDRKKKDEWTVVVGILSDAAGEIRDMLGDVP